MNFNVLRYLQTLLEEVDPKKLVVVYGGRFQPFHKGHFQSYKWLTKHFGSSNVWIATSNKTNFDPKAGEISPFTFAEKKKIITTLFDVEPRRIIEAQNPAFKPVEVFKQYRNYRPVYVAAVGRKDQERYVGNFFHPLPVDLTLPDQTSELLSLDEHAGYYVEVPMRQEGLSGTVVRQDLIAASAERSQLKKLFIEYFGTFDETIASLIIARLKEIK